MKCFAVFDGIGIFAFLLRSCERTEWPALHCMTISKGLRLSICFWGWSGVRWCRVNFKCRAAYKQIRAGQGPIAHAVGAGGRLLGHFSLSPLSFLFSFSFSLEDGLIKTKLLSQRAVKPQNNQSTNIYFCDVGPRRLTNRALIFYLITITFSRSSASEKYELSITPLLKENTFMSTWYKCILSKYTLLYNKYSFHKKLGLHLATNYS